MERFLLDFKKDLLCLHLLVTSHRREGCIFFLLHSMFFM